MIRILHFVGRMDVGGAETRLLQLVREADSSRYHFDFCVFEDGDYDEQVRNLGFGIIKCQLTKNIFSFIRQFRKLLQQGQYDVIHCHVHQFSGLPLRIAAKERIPIRIVHLRTTGDSVQPSLYKLAYQRLMCRWTKKHSTKVVAVSEAAMVSCMGREWKNDNRNIIIYNGLDVSPFLVKYERSNVLAEVGIPDTAIVVIHVGSFKAVKNHEMVIQCAKKIIKQNKEIHFLLVGDGQLMPNIRWMVSEEGIEDNVRFAGSRNDVPRLLLSSDCFIFPSKWEGLPGAVLEALTAGLPVVASDIGPTREIASQSNNVHLVPVEDTEGFFHKIEDILVSLEKYKKPPGQIPERFRFETYVSKMLALYENRVDKFN